jgi:hypothetical protein
MTVFHLSGDYARKYPQYERVATDESLRPPEHAPVEGCVHPRSVQQQWDAEYGTSFPGAVWVTHADSMDIARAVRPTPEEHVVTNGWQINGLCRRQGIDTLIYAGFMADLCLTNIPGAMREMAGTFRYTCVALRDCTTAYEFFDTHEGNWMTRAAVRLIETGMGFTITSDQFIASCSSTAKSAS